MSDDNSVIIPEIVTLPVLFCFCITVGLQKTRSESKPLLCYRPGRPGDLVIIGEKASRDRGFL